MSERDFGAQDPNGTMQSGTMQSGSPEGETKQEGDFQIDDLELQMLQERLRSEQNLGAGLAAGAVAALVGAGLWAVVTVMTGYQIGWMAVGIGFLVGLAIRHFGKGIDTSFAVAGAVLALAGCLVGNALSIYGFVSTEMEVPLSEVFSQVELDVLIQIMIDTFSPIDLLFYGIAVYEGWKLSKRQITPEELEQMLGETGSAA